MGLFMATSTFWLFAIFHPRNLCLPRMPHCFFFFLLARDRKAGGEGLTRLDSQAGHATSFLLPYNNKTPTPFFPMCTPTNTVLTPECQQMHHTDSKQRSARRACDYSRQPLTLTSSKGVNMGGKHACVYARARLVWLAQLSAIPIIISGWMATNILKKNLHFDSVPLTQKGKVPQKDPEKGTYRKSERNNKCTWDG